MSPIFCKSSLANRPKKCIYFLIPLPSLYSPSPNPWWLWCNLQINSEPINPYHHHPQHHPVCQMLLGIGWSDVVLFTIFENGHCMYCRSGIFFIFMSAIPNNQQSFHFRKITGTLKMIFFLNLEIPSFYIKEHLPKTTF